jgi:hypothetical protein
MGVPADHPTGNEEQIQIVTGGANRRQVIENSYTITPNYQINQFAFSGATTYQ